MVKYWLEEKPQSKAISVMGSCRMLQFISKYPPRSLPFLAESIGFPEYTLFWVFYDLAPGASLET